MPELIPVEVYAVSSAFFFSLRDIFIRLALRQATPLTGAIVVSALTCLFLLPVVLFHGSGLSLTWQGIGWFLLAGIAAPGLALLFFFASIGRVGVTRAAPLAGTTPLFSLLIAIPFLGERPGVPLYVGTVLIVLGLMTLAWEGGRFRWRAQGILFPLMAALLWAISSVLRKLGMEEIDSAAFGGLMAVSAALLVLTPSVRFFPEGNRWRLGLGSLPFLALAGLCMMGATFLYFFSLGQRTVGYVVPLLSISPLFTLPLSFLFLGRLERITRAIVLGTLLVGGGVILITGMEGR